MIMEFHIENCLGCRDKAGSILKLKFGGGNWRDMQISYNFDFKPDH